LLDGEVVGGVADWAEMLGLEIICAAFALGTSTGGEDIGQELGNIRRHCEKSLSTNGKERRNGLDHKMIFYSL
jgi:hypothetical protein